MEEKFYPRRRRTSSSIYPHQVMRRRFLVLAILLLSTLYFSGAVSFHSLTWQWRQNFIISKHAGQAKMDGAINDQVQPTNQSTREKVALEAHIMSKCPDARDCLRDLVVPSMEKVADLVDFQLSFIGECVFRLRDLPEITSFVIVMPLLIQILIGLIRPTIPLSTASTAPANA